MADFIGVVRDFVIENFLYGDAGQIDNDTSFLESGIVDSTGMLELVSFLEERFGIQVNDDELVPENLNSLSSITGYLRRKINGNIPS